MRPADDAPVAATITDPFSVERVEHGYEELSASVFERRSIGKRDVVARALHGRRAAARWVVIASRCRPVPHTAGTRGG
jgi:hypothetical protein